MIGISNKRPLRPLKSVAGRVKSARPKAGRYVFRDKPWKIL